LYLHQRIICATISVPFAPEIMITRFGVAIRAILLALAALAIGGWPIPVGAQDLPESRVLPGQERPTRPDFDEADRPASVLPPAPLPAEPMDVPRLGGLSIAVDRIRIDGNSVLESAALESIASDYEERTLTSEDLLDLRRAITRAYADAGFTTSFATIPDQDLSGATLRIQVVEGRLVDVTIEGNRHFRTGYIERRVAPHPDRPLNVFELEHRLQVLQSDPRIETLNAALSEGVRPGEAVLTLTIVESRQWRAQVAVANDRHSSIGGTNFRLGAGYSNFTGRGDDTAVAGAFATGLNELVAESWIPVNRFDTRVGVRGRFSSSEVVDGVFADLDIRSRFWSIGAGVSQPLYRSRSVDWDAAALWELRESKNTLGGRPLPTSVASRDGRLRASVFRLSTNLALRDVNQVFAARTMVSIGVPIAGAWTTPSGVDDSSFVSWLGQVQWARRFSLLDTELLTRFDWQLAFDPLPPFERFAVGGVHSVRGLPENRLVRDNGYAASIELRIPLMKYPDGRPQLAFAPFVDAGRAWHHDRGPTPEPGYLAGAGAGLLASLMPGVSAYFYWGAELTSTPEINDKLQDHGIHFGLTARSW